MATDTMELVTKSQWCFPMLDDILIDIGEPDWLKYFCIRIDDNYPYVECLDCHEDVCLQDLCSGDMVTLFDLKLWAYCHLEECGK